MKRIDPRKELHGFPCLMVALSCAKGYLITDINDLKDDGYATLKVANKHIRQYLKIKKRYDYKRGQRPLLKDLHLDGKALVCVYGHLIYLEGETYWSFFENEEDEVVAVWVIAEE